MITFKINDVPYENVVEASFNESMIDFTNEASFKIVLDGTESSPFILDDTVVVFMDNVFVMTGYIYDVNLSYDSGSHSLTYIVRDKTADFSDSDIDDIGDLGGSLSLTAIIKEVVKHLGTDIEVVNNFSDLKNFNLDNDDIKPSFAQNAFDYVEGLARKRQVLLTTNALGQISIIRNSGTLMRGKIQNSITNIDQNNILSCDFSQRNSEVYNKYIIRSQLGSASSKSPFGSGASNKEMVDQSGLFTNANVRVGRQQCLIAEESSTSDVNQERAEWQNNFADTESGNYSVSLQGHSIDGEVFKSNHLIHVIDDFARIDGNMLIKSVSATYDNNNGSITTLELVDKKAFLVLTEVENEEAEEDKDNIFEGL